jgi:hypothetical protein
MKIKTFPYRITFLLISAIAIYFAISCQKSENNFDFKSWSAQNNFHYLKSNAVVSDRYMQNTDLSILIPTKDGKQIEENKFFIVSDCKLNIKEGQEIEIAYDQLNLLIKVGQDFSLVTTDSSSQIRGKLISEKLKTFETGFSITTCDNRLTINKLLTPQQPDTSSIRNGLQTRLVGCDFLSGYESCGGGGTVGVSCGAGGQGSKSCSITASAPCSTCNASTSCGPKYFSCCNVKWTPIWNVRPDGKTERGIEYYAVAVCYKE